VERRLQSVQGNNPGVAATTSYCSTRCKFATCLRSVTYAFTYRLRRLEFGLLIHMGTDLYYFSILNHPRRESSTVVFVREGGLGEDCLTGPSVSYRLDLAEGAFLTFPAGLARNASFRFATFTSSASQSMSWCSAFGSISLSSSSM